MTFVDPDGKYMAINPAMRQWYDEHPFLTMFSDPRNSIPMPAAIAQPVKGPLAGLLEKVAGPLRELLGVGQAAEANVAGKVAAGTTKSAIGATAKVGEDALKTLGGKSNVFFKTDLGARYVDQLANNIANESKVGYQSLTPRIGMQVAKDAALLEGGEVKGVAWHFFRSPVTGKMGASQPLLNTLMDEGFEIVRH